MLTFLTFPTTAQQANAASQPTDGRACMILALYHEARGESAESIAKHAWTVVWRVKRREFPNSLCAVIFQPGKFSAFNRVWEYGERIHGAGGSNANRDGRARR